MKAIYLGIVSSIVIGSSLCQMTALADDTKDEGKGEAKKEFHLREKLHQLKFWDKGIHDDSSSDESSDSSSSVGKEQVGKPGSHIHQLSVIKNSMVFEKVKLNKENKLAGYYNKRVSCENLFEGTHAGNEIYIRAESSGTHGRVTHTLAYQFGDGYEFKNKEEGQHQISRHRDGVFKVKLPLLKDSVPFVEQTFFLSTRDSEGGSATTTKTIRVSRPMILTVSADPLATKNNCYQRYEPYESSVGVLSNGSTDSSHIEIRQGVEKIYTNAHGRQFGVYLNPTVGVNGILVSLLSLNYGYFSETSKQTVQTMDVTHKYELSPGDLYQVYIQPTRYVTAYDATLVKPCGETEKLDGAYLFQWWGYAYHVYPIDPLDKNRPLTSAIGAPVENTCSSELEMIVGNPDIHQAGPFTQAGKQL